MIVRPSQMPLVPGDLAILHSALDQCSYLPGGRRGLICSAEVPVC